MLIKLKNKLKNKTQSHQHLSCTSVSFLEVSQMTDNSIYHRQNTRDIGLWLSHQFMFQGIISITNYSNQSLFRTLGMYCSVQVELTTTRIVLRLKPGPTSGLVGKKNPKSECEWIKLVGIWWRYHGWISFDVPMWWPVSTIALIPCRSCI